MPHPNHQENISQHDSPTLPGLFVTGTSTEVGKTYASCQILKQLFRKQKRPLVYKAAESGVDPHQIEMSDSFQLWEAAGKPGSLEAVCPQRFQKPLAPHLAAQAEGKTINETLLFEGGQQLPVKNHDFLLIEGAGGLLSPISENLYVADLALKFGLPLLIVAPNELGVINQVLQTITTAKHYFDEPLPVAGLILNQTTPPQTNHDLSQDSNFLQLQKRLDLPILCSLPFAANDFEPAIDWFAVAKQFLH